jgi:hypothetical protein
MNFELLRLSEASLGQPLADVLPLVTLELEHFTVLRMFNHSAIAGKLLKQEIPEIKMTTRKMHLWKTDMF